MTKSLFNEDLITVQNNKNEPENYSHQEIPATSYSLQIKNLSLIQLRRAYVGLYLNSCPRGPTKTGSNS